MLAGPLGAFGVVVRPQAAVFFLLPALLGVLIARRKELARSVGFLVLWRVRAGARPPSVDARNEPGCLIGVETVLLRKRLVESPLLHAHAVKEHDTDGDDDDERR